MRSFHTCLLAALGVGVLSAAAVPAATMYSDDFSSATIVNPGDPVEVSSSLGWHAQDSSVDLSINSEIDGNSLGFVSSSRNRLVNGFLPDAVTLGEVGDYIQVTFDVFYPSAVDDRDGFEFGFVDSNGTTVEPDGSVSGTFADDLGFNGAVNMNVPASPENDGIAAEINGETGDNNLGRISIVANPDVSTAADTLALRLTRVADADSDGSDDIEITVSGDLINGGSATRSDDDPNTFTFDAVLFRLAGDPDGGGPLTNQGPVSFDNVVVESNVVIPEPGVLGLLGVGALGLLARRP